MMEKAGRFSFSPASITWGAVFIASLTLPLGILLIATGQYTWGLLLLAAGAVVVAASVSQRVRAAIGRRTYPRARGYAIVYSWAFFAVLIVLTLALLSPVLGVRNEVYVGVYVAVVLALLGIAIWHILKSIRASG